VLVLLLFILARLYTHLHLLWFREVGKTQVFWGILGGRPLLLWRNRVRFGDTHAQFTATSATTRLPCRCSGWWLLPAGLFDHGLA
jgi:hypothetical protein